MDDTREIVFLKDAIQAVKEKNVYNLKVAITKLKQYVDINKWKINMFNKIVTKLEEAAQNINEAEDDIGKYI
jgi:2C-methyl-D-erythritol 2,4-cyclodiphosphate synthase